jgi:hypothetical protein
MDSDNKRGGCRTQRLGMAFEFLFGLVGQALCLKSHVATDGWLCNKLRCVCMVTPRSEHPASWCGRKLVVAGIIICGSLMLQHTMHSACAAVCQMCTACHAMLRLSSTMRDS